MADEQTPVEDMGLRRVVAEKATLQASMDAAPATDYMGRARMTDLEGREQKLRATVDALADPAGDWTPERAGKWMVGYRSAEKKHATETAALEKAREVAKASGRVKVDESNLPEQPQALPPEIKTPEQRRAFTDALAKANGDQRLGSAIASAMKDLYLGQRQTLRQIDAEAEARGLGGDQQAFENAILNPDDTWSEPDPGEAFDFLKVGSPRALPFVDRLSGPGTFESWKDNLGSSDRWAGELAKRWPDILEEATAMDFLDARQGGIGGEWVYTHKHSGLPVKVPAKLAKALAELRK